MNQPQSWKQGWQRWQAIPEAELQVFCAGDAESGPTALITAGVHGDEYEGPSAIAALSRDLANVSLRGRVLLAPVVNPLARLTGTRVTQEDKKNLARCFPGKADGSITERLASAVFEHLLLKCDFLIDLHSGGVEYLFVPLAGFYGEVSNNNHSYVSACRFGLPSLWQLPLTTGVLSNEANRVGKVAIGHEYLGAGQLSQAGVEAYTAGVKNCLRAWSILPTASAAALPEQRCYTGDWQLSETSGLFIPNVRLGDAVEAGALLANVRDERGAMVAEMRALFAGDVLGLRSKAHIERGAWAVLLGRRQHLV
jgi:N-alpha-acetyl-L-2,4-diaminobutyrate deacetylase